MLMQIRTPLEFGVVIRDRRRRLRWTQAELARKAGVTRQWIVAVERGKPRVEFRLVLRTLSALGLPLMIDPDKPLPSPDGGLHDIDAVLKAAARDVQ